MAKIVFSNSASSLLAASIDDNDTVIQVGSGEGALFPDPGATEYFVIRLVNANGDLEICHCTSRTTDLLTVERAKEGTAAQSWTNGATRVELSLTKGVMEVMVQKTGDTMEGNLDMDDNELQNALIVDPVVQGGVAVGTALRGVVDDDSNEILVPEDGTRATAGGARIRTEADNGLLYIPIGAVIMWFGSLGSLPTGWQNCDGSNGTPDMRGMFPRGAGGSIALGASGGSETAAGSTDAAGAHTHSAAADATALSVAQMPAHHHSLRGSSGGGISAEGSIPGGFGLLSDFSPGHSVGSYHENLTINGLPIVENTGGDATHGHSVTVGTAADHSHSIATIATVPPYKGIYFIMRVA